MGEVIPLQHNLDICRILGREVSDCFATEELPQEAEAALGFVFGASTYLSVQLVLGQQVYLSLGLLPKETSCRVLLFHEDRSVAGICVQSEAMASCRANLVRNRWLQDVTNVHRACEAYAITSIPMFLDVTGKRQEVALQMLHDCPEDALDKYMDMSNGVCIGCITVGYHKLGEEHVMRVFNNALLLSLSLAPHVLRDADQLLLNVALYTQLISPSECYEFVPGYGHVPAEEGLLATVGDSATVLSSEESEDETQQAERKPSSSSCMPDDLSNNGDTDGSAPGAVIVYSPPEETESEIEMTAAEQGSLEKGTTVVGGLEWEATSSSAPEETQESCTIKTLMFTGQHPWVLFFLNFKLELLYINQLMARNQGVSLCHLLAILLYLWKYGVQGTTEMAVQQAQVFWIAAIVSASAVVFCFTCMHRWPERHGWYLNRLFVFLDFLVLCIAGPLLFMTSMQGGGEEPHLKRWFAVEVASNLVTPCALLVRCCWSAPLMLFSSLGWLAPAIALCRINSSIQECLLYNWAVPVLAAATIALPLLWISESQSRKMFRKALTTQAVQLQ